jgi:hypothetical protein
MGYIIFMYIPRKDNLIGNMFIIINQPVNRPCVLTNPYGFDMVVAGSMEKF